MISFSLPFPPGQTACLLLIFHLLPPLLFPLPDTTEYQDVVVEIERATRRTAFLGGYRHKAAGTEYHHAAVQTMARRKPDTGVETFSRDTQVAPTHPPQNELQHTYNKHAHSRTHLLALSDDSHTHRCRNSRRLALIGCSLWTRTHTSIGLTYITIDYAHGGTNVGPLMYAHTRTPSHSNPPGWQQRNEIPCLCGCAFM